MVTDWGCVLQPKDSPRARSPNSPNILSGQTLPSVCSPTLQPRFLDGRITECSIANGSVERAVDDPQTATIKPAVIYGSAHGSMDPASFKSVVKHPENHDSRKVCPADKLAIRGTLGAQVATWKRLSTETTCKTMKYPLTR